MANSPTRIRRGTLAKKGTFVSDGTTDNIFANQAQINHMTQDVYGEKPRANLYNVIKKLRESKVSRPNFIVTNLKRFTAI